jgi:hypothetical protein
VAAALVAVSGAGQDLVPIEAGAGAESWNAFQSTDDAAHSSSLRITNSQQSANRRTAAVVCSALMFACLWAT